MTEREKMLGGELYGAFEPELVALRQRARELCAAQNRRRLRGRQRLPRHPHVALAGSGTMLVIP